MGRSVKMERSEDEQLAKSLTAVSENPIQGNDQSKDTFWSSIHQHWKAALGSSCKNDRSSTACKNRWADINAKVQKFAGCLTKVENLNISGTNNEDTMTKAHEMYHEVYQEVFVLEHVWRVLQHVPK